MKGWAKQRNGQCCGASERAPCGFGCTWDQDGKPEGWEPERDPGISTAIQLKIQEEKGGEGKKRRKSNRAEDTWVPRLKCPLSISGKETYPRHSVWNSEQQRERETLRSFQINISYNGQESVHFSRTILIIGQQSNFFKVLRDNYSAPRIPFPAWVSFKMKSQMTNTDSEEPWNVPD